MERNQTTRRMYVCSVCGEVYYFIIFFYIFSASSRSPSFSMLSLCIPLFTYVPSVHFLSPVQCYFYAIFSFFSTKNSFPILQSCCVFFIFIFRKLSRPCYFHVLTVATSMWILSEIFIFLFPPPPFFFFGFSSQVLFPMSQESTLLPRFEEREKVLLFLI